MPQLKAAKRRCAPATARLRKIMDRALDMEGPLDEATELVHALRMIGDGMLADYNQDGRPVAAVARAALQVSPRWRRRGRSSSKPPPCEPRHS